jgi:uncharacterized membrane protein (DUF4010 family)
MMAIMPSPWFNFVVALGLGLLIGVERERSKGEGPTRRSAGIRTFTLAALLGAVAAHVGGALLLAIVTGAVALLTALSYWRDQGTDPGLTTEVGLLALPILGGLAMSDTLLASGLGVTVAGVFAAKVPLHQFVKSVLTDAEVKDGIVFAVATLVVWPQLPDRYMGPFQAINPHTLWLLVVLVLAIGACGHVSTRAFGSRYGLPLAGLASGFVSSTATIGSMAGRALKEPSAMAAAVAGATLSTVATFVQMALLLFATSQPALVLMAPALATGCVVAALYGLVFTVQALNSNDIPESDTGRAFSFMAALALAATMAVMLLIAAALKNWLGETGIIFGAAIAGLVDTHSAAISVASMASSGKLMPQETVLPILAAMTTNALAKIVMAVSTGSAGSALRIVPGIALSAAATWAAATIFIIG